MTLQADGVAIQILADVDAADANIKKHARTFDAAMKSDEAAAKSMERAVSSSSTRAGKSLDAIDAGARRAANGTRNLGRQVADIGVGLASGQSPFLILAQQAPQVADALADTQGKAASVARFFAGPWGAAILAGASILATVFIPKLFETGDAADKNAQKLRNFANAAALGDRQKESFDTLKQLNNARNELTRLQTSDTARGSVLAFSGGQAGVDSKIDSLTKKISGLTREYRQQADALNIYADRGRAAAAIDSAIEQSMDHIGAATNRNTAVNNKYRDSIKDLSDALRSGKIDQASFDRQALGATKVRDVSLEAIIKSEEAVRQAAADRKRAIKEAEKAYRDFVDFFKSPGALAHDFDSIKVGNPDAGFGTTYRDATGVSQNTDVAKDIDEREQREYEANQTISDDLAQKMKDRIRTVADFYEDAMSGRAGSIGDILKSVLIRAIAQALAANAIAGGGAGGIFKSVIGSVKGILGFAGGGGFTIGGNGGVDQNMMSINGRPVARVSAGERVEITPPGRARGGGGGRTLLQTINVDARGAVMNDQFASMILARANQDAAHMDARSLQAASKAAPGRLQQFSNYEG